MEQTIIDRALHELSAVDQEYPVKLTAHYQSLIREPGDGIWKQCIPDPEELNPHGLSDDGLGEHGQSPCARLIHKYSDRALIVTTNCCFAHCRFCFRKRLWKRGSRDGSITDAELADILAYLEQHHEIKDVLLSGGDPLTLSDARLDELIGRISGTGAVETVRICSRAPVFEPSRITDRLAAMLGSHPGIWFMTHFNHPAELTEASLSACRKLQKQGIPVLNQTVLLKNVNDDAKILIKLFRGLAKSQIKPHYLFSEDPIRGAGHFAVPLEKGLAILEELRGSLSSIATPVYAIDLPEGGGKVPLLPDYAGTRPGEYRSIDGRMIVHPLGVLNKNEGRKLK